MADAMKKQDYEKAIYRLNVINNKIYNLNKSIDSLSNISKSVLLVNDRPVSSDILTNSKSILNNASYNIYYNIIPKMKKKI